MSSDFIIIQHLELDTDFFALNGYDHHTESVFESQSFWGFDEAERMKPSAYYDRVVDVMEELMKFTMPTRGPSNSLTDRYSERKESAEELSRRVNPKVI